MIPAPLLLVGAPLLFAAVVYFLRRLTWVAALVSAAGALALAWLVRAIPNSADATILGGRVVGGVQIILGRPLALADADRPVLLALSLTAAALFLLAAHYRPGDFFFPGLLGLLGAAAAVLVTETFTFAVLLVEVAAGLATLLLQGSRFGPTRGAWRFFVFTTLAMPFLLVAGWQIDLQTANPGQSNLLNPAVMLLTFGFSIYLAAVPFHLWLAPLARENAPLKLVVALGLFPLIAFSVIAGALGQYPWFADSSVPLQWFAFAGTLTAGLGTLLAFGAGRFGDLAAYTLLVDVGTVLLLVGLGEPDGLQAAWSVLLMRPASLIVWAAGLSALKTIAPADRVDEAAGKGWQAKLATAVLVLGGLALAGFPLTPGFPGRWMAAGLIARDSLPRAALLLAGSASGALGTLRVARTLLTAPAENAPESQPASRGRWLGAILLLIIIAGAVLLSLYPNPIISAAGQLANQFTPIP